LPSIVPGLVVGTALGLVVSGAWLFSAGESLSSTRPAPTFTTPSHRGGPEVASARARERKASPATDLPTAPRRDWVETTVAPKANAPLAPASEAPSVGVAGAPGEGLETEAHLLARAKDALGPSPAEAYALTIEHAARFPAGALVQERELLAIQALVRLGRGNEAESRRTRFLAAFPGSAYRPVIQTAERP